MRVGLFFGVVLILYLVYQVFLNGWNNFYIAIYLFITIFQMVSSGDENEDSIFNFLTGLNIPILLLLLSLFKCVDFINKKR